MPQPGHSKRVFIVSSFKPWVMFWLDHFPFNMIQLLMSFEIVSTIKLIQTLQVWEVIRTQELGGNLIFIHHIKYGSGSVLFKKKKSYFQTSPKGNKIRVN